MQELLSAAGFFVKVDGLFGVKTDSALRAFQDHIGLEADGIYGELAKVALMKTAPKLGTMGFILNAIWSIARSFKWQKLRGKG
ncbi:MAG: peptidoglycan-binding domain-containing protein [Pseudomonadota bacterium]